jgi:hypothetical protein
MDAGLDAFASADPLRDEFEAEIQLAAATGWHPASCHPFFGNHFLFVFWRSLFSSFSSFFPTVCLSDFY